MIYEFWDTRSHNLVHAFDSEREALPSLRDADKLQGNGVTNYHIPIGDDPENDASRVVAVGTGLMYRVLHLS